MIHQSCDLKSIVSNLITFFFLAFSCPAKRLASPECYRHRIVIAEIFDA